VRTGPARYHLRRGRGGRPQAAPVPDRGEPAGGAGGSGAPARRPPALLPVRVVAVPAVPTDRRRPLERRRRRRRPGEAVVKVVTIATDPGHPFLTGLLAPSCAAHGLDLTVLSPVTPSFRMADKRAILRG